MEGPYLQENTKRHNKVFLISSICFYCDDQLNRAELQIFVCLFLIGAVRVCLFFSLLLITLWFVMYCLIYILHVFFTYIIISTLTILEIVVLPALMFKIFD